MQASPRSDFPVRVRPRSWDEGPALATLYAGVYDVTLNQAVTITFVPEPSDSRPPIQRSSLPADLDDITTTEQARVEALLFADRAVTPDDSRAGTHAGLPVPAWRREGQSLSGTVFYVTSQEFAAYSADLESLVAEHGSLHSDTPISSLRGHPAIDFIEELLLHPAFGTRDLSMLRDGG